MSTPNKELTYYLSGPMTGIPHHNYPAFDAAASVLRSQGFKIISPAELDMEARLPAMASEDGTPDKYDAQYWNWLARDVFVVSTRVQGIILLSGWHLSKGACLEAYVGLITEKVFLRYFPPAFSQPYALVDYQRSHIAVLLQDNLKEIE